MSDAELVAEIEAQAHATWRRPNLIEHHRSHSYEWPRYLDEQAPSLEEYANIASDIVRTWDRIFLAVEGGGLTWLFVRLVGDGSVAIVAAARRGRIRTTLVASKLEMWLRRQLDDHGAIEVTERARLARRQH